MVMFCDALSGLGCRSDRPGLVQCRLWCELQGKMDSLSWSLWTRCRGETWTQITLRGWKCSAPWERLCEPGGISVTFDEEVMEDFGSGIFGLCLRPADRGLAVQLDGVWWGACTLLGILKERAVRLGRWAGDSFVGKAKEAGLILQANDFPSVPWPAPISPGSWLEMQILEPNLRPIGSESQGWGTATCGLPGP